MAPPDNLPYVSFIIVNRNTADLLIRCLEHIVRSDLPCRTEVIVVDNGSRDDSVARVRNIFPEAVVLEAGRNLGFAAANNLGAKAASGRLLLLVNTDAMLDPNCAARLVSLMDGAPRIGMAGPQLLNADRTTQTSYEAVPSLATETLNRSLLKRLFPARYPHKSRVPTGPIEVEALIGAVMVVRRAALDDVGGFDEGYFFFLEETDLAVTMRSKGWTVVHEPRASAVHLQGATAGSYPAEARIEFYRSRYRFFRKNYGRAAELILKAAMVANLSLNVVFLGMINSLTLLRVKSLLHKLRVRARLWLWHMQGCPDGIGLPRD